MKTHVDLVDGGNNVIADQMTVNGRMDPGALKPYLAKNKKTGVVGSYVTVFTGGDAKDPKNYRTTPTTNATLRRDEWKLLDSAVTGIAESRLGGVADLVANGLTYNLGNAMGTTVLETHDVAGDLTAELTMDGLTRGENNRPNYQHNYLPIPIIHVDYEINSRALAASRNMGNAIDTTLAERAARGVNLKLEQMLFTNVTYAYGETDSRTRNSIYSYINFPDRNQVTLSTDWDDSAKTAAGIYAEVLNMVQTSINNYHYGPWMLYIPTAYQTVLEEDYETGAVNGLTIRERIMKIDGLKGIKVVDTLTADNVLLVQMTSDVVRLVRGMGIQNIEWSEEGRFINKFKVITIQVPQIRSTQAGSCRIVHLAA